MLMGAALMRSGWLKGQFSLRHYRRTGCFLIALGVAINLPAIIAQWQLDWAYRWCAFILQAPRELGAYRCWAMPRLSLASGRTAVAGWWLACVGRMALSNYLLQTLICTTCFIASACL
jgi:uncharacterized protein